ncbi:PAS domain S-box protein, partial [Brevibacillus panacihumi]
MKHTLPPLEHLIRKVPAEERNHWEANTQMLSVPLDTPLSEAIPLFQQSDPLWVTDASGQWVGCLHQADAMRAVLQSFQYLEAYFTTLIETLDLSISAIDEEANVVVWSQVAEQLFSLKANELLGKPITNFFSAEMLAMLKTLQTGEAVHRKHHQPREDLFVVINTNPIRLNGKIIGAVATETDITSQVRLNQELYDATKKVHHLQQEMARLKPSSDPFHEIKGKSKAIAH